MADGDGITDVVDQSGNGKGVALNVYPYFGNPLVYDTYGDFPITGSERNTYVANDTEIVYRWDTAAGAYVQIPPPFDTPYATPEEFGAVGDGVTNDAVALQAWLDAGGDLYLPGREYYSAAKLIVRKCVRIQGVAYGFDARIVDGSSTLGYENQPGSRIKFAAGAGGLDFQPQTTVTDVATAIAAGIGGFTQEGARGSVVRDIALIGAGTGAAATGIYSRTLVVLVNVHAYKFMGKGFDISASGDAPDGNSEYGNASLSILLGCHAVRNGSHGFHIRGRDANVIKLDTCNADNNGGWGFNDDALLGNKYDNCHAAGNASGSYRASSAVAFHKYDGCYIEDDAGKQTSLTAACVVDGGPMANDAYYSTVNLALRFNAGDIINIGELKADNSGIVKISKGFLDITEDQGFAAPATGGRLQWNSSSGLALCGTGAVYDFGIRTANGASVLLIAHNSTDVRFIGSPDADVSIKVNGNKVVGARGAALPADATDLASVITLANAIKARMKVTGGHGLVAD